MASGAAHQNTPVERFLAQTPTLAGLPENTSRIIRMANDPNCDMFQLLKLISTDAALVGRIIRAVNSPYYGLQHKVTQLDRAMSFLGLKGVKDFAMAASLSSMFKGGRFGRWTTRDLWDHSLAVGLLARELAVASREPAASTPRRPDDHDPAEEAFTAGLLHDIGLMAEAQAATGDLATAINAAMTVDVPLREVERRTFGFDHTELGAALAERWKFPEVIRAAVAHHHAPQNAPPDAARVAWLVYVADTLVCRHGIGFTLTAKEQPLDEFHLASAGLTRAIADASAAQLNRLIELARPLAA